MPNKRTLITIEGNDGSGKATQTKLLCDKLTQAGAQVKKLSFPCYDEPSSDMVKLYLNGYFGTDPSKVNPYAASTFYAVDRFASFERNWRSNYEADELIITDRYVMSNVTHQASKMPPEVRDGFIKWLYDLEFKRFGIPRPDHVIYLYLDPEVNEKLRAERGDNKHDGKDIHESNSEYMRHVAEISLTIAKEQNWHIIRCDDGSGNMRSIEDINRDILNDLDQLLVTRLDRYAYRSLFRNP